MDSIFKLELYTLGAIILSAYFIMFLFEIIIPFSIDYFINRRVKKAIFKITGDKVDKISISDYTLDATCIKYHPNNQKKCWTIPRQELEIIFLKYNKYEK